MSYFTLDLERIRTESRTRIYEGAITPNYKADRQAILLLLDSALATEWLCVLRYTQHSVAARGIHADYVAQHFASHARQEQEHALQLAIRIKQLGGNPSLSPESLALRGHTEYKEAESLVDMIRENLIAERIAIESYREMISYIGEKDPTTRRLLEDILEVEEEHADEMANLLEDFDSSQ